MAKHDYLWLVTARADTNFMLGLQFQAFRDLAIQERPVNAAANRLTSGE